MEQTTIVIVARAQRKEILESFISTFDFFNRNRRHFDLTSQDFGTASQKSSIEMSPSVVCNVTDCGGGDGVRLHIFKCDFRI